jgi:outer membrane protein insertion porin family
MLKILFKSLIFYALLFTISFAEIVNEIKIFGNKRISKESIIILGSIEIGSIYNDNLSNQILKELYETNFFEDIDINFENNSLVINVKEYPIIDELVISGIKKKSFLDFIKENIYLKERNSFNSIFLNQDIILIQNILKRNGYYFSSIETNFSKNENLNSVVVNISVNLGEKAKLNDIQFIGNKVFPDKRLLEIIVSEEHKFWKFLSRNVFLNESLIKIDKNLLKNFYLNRGYYNVKILDTFALSNKKNSSFNLVYNIDAGQKYITSNFSLNLPPDYDKDDFIIINQIFEKNINKKYSKRIIDQILNELEKIASNRLYDYIDVSVQETIIENNELHFEFTISDSKKFYVERINILGNNTTIEEVVRNKLIIDEGDPLNNILFKKSINNIKSLNIFKDVKTEISNGRNDNYKIIDIKVEEQPTGQISLAAGVGTDGLTTGGSLSERNFLGKGITLDTFIEISEESLKGELSYAKPNFAYTDNTLFTSIRSINNDFISLYGYETDELGISLGTKYEQYENLYFSPELEFTFEDLSTNVNASNTLKKQEGNYNDFYFNYGLDYDFRDSSFRPKSGFLTNFYQEIPIISKTNEISNTFIHTIYKELREDTEMIGKASVYLKSINTIDNSDVRVSRRAYVPYSRLRGFEKGKVGPVDNNDYIGGNYVSTINLSTNLPGLFPTLEILDFNYFIDVANVWGVDYDSSLDNSKIRSSTGLGVNVSTPIGPLSFSLTQPITKSSLDKTENFRFNLGTSF